MASKVKYVKRSGAKIVQRLGSDLGLFITAWKVTNGVLWKYTVHVARDKKGVQYDVVEAKNGKDYISVIVVGAAPNHSKVFVYGFMDVKTHQVFIKDWNWTIKPSSPNGGYVGKHISNQYDK